MPNAKSRRRSAAVYDDLARMIHAAIELLEEAHRIGSDADTSYAPYNGYCARACSAYTYLVEHEPRARALSGNPPMRLKKLKEKGAAFGESHYWLEDDDGRVLDLIFVDRKRLPRDIEYGRGKGANVLKARHDKRLPARTDTQRIITVVRAALD